MTVCDKSPLKTPRYSLNLIHHRVPRCLTVPLNTHYCDVWVIKSFTLTTSQATFFLPAWICEHIKYKCKPCVRLSWVISPHLQCFRRYEPQHSRSQLKHQHMEIVPLGDRQQTDSLHWRREVTRGQHHLAKDLQSFQRERNKDRKTYQLIPEMSALFTAESGGRKYCCTPRSVTKHPTCSILTPPAVSRSAT